MSILDDLKQAPITKPSLAEWLIRLTPTERAAWDQAIEDGASSDYLAKVVRKHGGQTTREKITEWRLKRDAR